MLSTSRHMTRLAIFGALAIAATTAVAGPAVTPLVSVEWLNQHAGDPDLRVIDLRDSAGYAEGHVPGAIRVDFPGQWRVERNGVPGMLPEIPDLEAHVSSLGIGPQTSVVVMPIGRNSADLGQATSIYFILKYLGHDSVAVLDGGAPGWAASAARQVETADGTAPAPAPTKFVAAPRPDLLATVDEVEASLGTDTVLVDARSHAEYTGTATSRLVTRAGHIPGAVNIENASLYDADNSRLKPRDQLIALVPPEVGSADSIISYCNTGQLGSIDWFVLSEIVGLEHVMLYDGSMAEWSRTELPIETGPSG